MLPRALLSGCAELRTAAATHRSRLSEVSMSLWIRLCNHTYIHTYILTHRLPPSRLCRLQFDL